MSTNKYLLEMEDTRTCIICNVIHTECKMIGRFCLGCLTMRPEWCPLIVVDGTDIAGKQFHVRMR